MIMEKTNKTSFLSVYFWIVILFLLLPIFIIIPISLTSGDLLRFPPTEWGGRWYLDYFTSPAWVDATLLSIKIGVLSSLIATITGTLAVVALERFDISGKAVLLQVFSAPLIIPHIFLAVGVFVLAVRLGQTNNEYFVACAHAVVTLPFVILIVGSALRKTDISLERAARILGAGPIKAFMVASFPPIFPAIIAAAMLSFFISFDELIIAEFLLSGKETLPMKIWADVRLELKPTVAAVSSILIILTSIAIIFVEFLKRNSEKNIAT